MEDLETTIMELLVNAGAARSAALTALQMARKGSNRVCGVTGFFAATSAFPKVK